MGFKIKEPSKDSPLEETEILSRIEQLWLVAEQHRGAVIGGLLLICLTVVGVGVLLWIEQENESQALALQHQAAQLYLDRSLEESDQSQENLEKSISLYRQIAKDYPRSSSGELAHYFIGNALMEKEDFKGAITAYRQYIQDYGTSSELILGFVYQRLGYAYLLEGDREQAVESFTQVLNTPGALNKDQVLFELAKLEEEDNHPDQAVAYYNELMTHSPNSPFVGEASLRIKSLSPTEEEDKEENEGISEAGTATEKTGTQEPTQPEEDTP